MRHSNSFNQAKQTLQEQIPKSEFVEDLPHAEDTLKWLLELDPNADEVLQLAAFGHDVERSLEDHFTANMFPDYISYKFAHAKRSGLIVADILLSAGYSAGDAKRAAHIISLAEAPSQERDVQLLCDADSISFFHSNLNYYLERKGKKATEEKAQFMYDRLNPDARRYIAGILAKSAIRLSL